MHVSLNPWREGCSDHPNSMAVCQIRSITTASWADRLCCTRMVARFPAFAMRQRSLCMYQALSTWRCGHAISNGMQLCSHSGLPNICTDARRDYLCFFSTICCARAAALQRLSCADGSISERPAANASRAAWYQLQANKLTLLLLVSSICPSKLEAVAKPLLSKALM